jgi:hypothetical protein
VKKRGLFLWLDVLQEGELLESLKRPILHFIIVVCIEYILLHLTREFRDLSSYSIIVLLG